MAAEDDAYDPIVEARARCRSLALGASQAGREAANCTDAFHLGKTALAWEEAELALSRALVASETFGGSQAAGRALDRSQG
jgi:hypothetical protein